MNVVYQNLSADDLCNHLTREFVYAQNIINDQTTDRNFKKMAVTATVNIITEQIDALLEKI